MDKLRLNIDNLTVQEVDKIISQYPKSIKELKKIDNKGLFEKVFSQCGGKIEVINNKTKYNTPKGFSYNWKILYDVLLGVSSKDVETMIMILDSKRYIKIKENEQELTPSEKLYKMYYRWNWATSILTLSEYDINLFDKSKVWKEQLNEVQNYVDGFIKTQKHFRKIENEELNKIRGSLQDKIDNERKQKELKTSNRLHKKKEKEIKIRTIERYGGEIYRKFLNGDFTLQEAYNHTKSKSRGAKDFITSSDIKPEESESYYLPFNKHPLLKSSKFNITFDMINRMNYKDFREFSIELRSELFRIWKELNTPPYVGKSKEDIINDFKKLRKEDTTEIRIKGDYYYEYIISNDWSFGSSCNQFQPGLLKTRINGISLWDILEKDEYKLKWIRLFTRNLKQDYTYEFSSQLRSKSDIKNLDLKTYGIIIQKKDINDELSFSKSEINKLKREGIIQNFHITNLGIDWDSYKIFEIRIYEKTKKTFTHIINIIKEGIINTPVNFSPFVARFIYENYLPKKKSSIVYDSSIGWGERLLGSIMSDRKIKYLGCDVNSNLFLPTNTFESLGSFIQDNFDLEPDFSIQQISSTNYDKTENYKTFKGKCDLILTSPPHYICEEYSEDSDQSYLKYKKYNDWLNIFIRKTFEIGYDMLKTGGLCFLNISDVTVKSQKFNLELDVLNIMEEIGWKYKYDIGLKMKRFNGLKTDLKINSYYDENKKTFVRVDTIMVFEK